MFLQYYYNFQFVSARSQACTPLIQWLHTERCVRGCVWLPSPMWSMNSVNNYEMLESTKPVRIRTGRNTHKGKVVESESAHTFAFRTRLSPVGNLNLRNYYNVAEITVLYLKRITVNTQLSISLRRQLVLLQWNAIGSEWAVCTHYTWGIAMSYSNMLSNAPMSSSFKSGPCRHNIIL